MHVNPASSTSTRAAASDAANAAATSSFEGELRELVVELRAVIADLRADNRRLREQLGEKAAPVVAIAAKRGRRER